MSVPKLKYFLLLFLLADLGYSFFLHFHAPLDGDLAGILLPAPWYQAVLTDPFGWRILIHGESHAGAGRFFVHWLMGVYFRNIPFWLQSFLSPLDSIYAAAALLRTGVQAGLIALLAAYICGHVKVLRTDFLLAAALVTPFFQSTGYYIVMGIVDRSVTYTCFYAFPLLLLLLFFLPFYLAWRQECPLRFRFLQKILLALLVVVLAFSGPLIAPVVVLLCPTVLLYRWWGYVRSGNGPVVSVRRIDPLLLGYFSLLSVLCVYGWYIGTFNAESNEFTASLAERYGRLGEGLRKQLTQRLGWPLLLVLAGVNAWLLSRLPPDTGAGRVRRLLLWIALFAGVYLLLLPLGGYREYRSFIVRRDTMLPVTLAVVFGVGYTSYFLLHVLTGRQRQLFRLFLIALLALFTLVDTPDFRHYRCERNALETLADATGPTVRLSGECTILGWVNVTRPGGSTLNVELLNYWGVLNDKDKRYYQE